MRRAALDDVAVVTGFFSHWFDSSPGNARNKGETMAKQRPSVQKRERDMKKRERDRKKSEKAALKRERRHGGAGVEAPALVPDAPDHGIDTPL